MKITTVKAKGEPRNILVGSIDRAIEKAERYGTKLAVKRNGRIKLETPDEFEKHLPEDLK